MQVGILPSVHSCLKPPADSYRAMSGKVMSGRKCETANGFVSVVFTPPGGRSKGWGEGGCKPVLLFSFSIVPTEGVTRP